MPRTAGDWGVLDMPGSLTIVSDGKRGVREIATVNAAVPDGDPRANAHLLAASPVMLRALKATQDEQPGRADLVRDAIALAEAA